MKIINFKPNLKISILLLLFLSLEVIATLNELSENNRLKV